MKRPYKKTALRKLQGNSLSKIILPVFIVPVHFDRINSPFSVFSLTKELNELWDYFESRLPGGVQTWKQIGLVGLGILGLIVILLWLRHRHKAHHLDAPVNAEPLKGVISSNNPTTQSEFKVQPPAEVKPANPEEQQ
jgi:hypothetical protein